MQQHKKFDFNNAFACVLTAYTLYDELAADIGLAGYVVGSQKVQISYFCLDLQNDHARFRTGDLVGVNDM